MNSKQVNLWLTMKLFVIVGIFFVTIPVFATSINLPSDADLIRSSRVILQGDVVAIQSRYNQDHSLIYTYVAIQVNTYYKGALRTNTVVLRELGGKVGNQLQIVDGSPIYRVGEKVLVYLNPAPDGALHSAFLFAGKFKITTPPKSGVQTATRLTRDDFQGRVTVRSLEGPTAGSVTNSMELSQYVQLIQDTLAAGIPLPPNIEDDSSRPVLAIPEEITPGSTGEACQATPDASLVWGPGQSVNFALNQEFGPGGDGGQSVFSAALNQSRTSIQNGGLTEAYGFKADGVNSVSFEDLLDQTDAPVNQSGVLAISGLTATLAVVQGEPNTIQEADIVIGRDFQRFGGNEVVTQVISDELVTTARIIGGGIVVPPPIQQTGGVPKIFSFSNSTSPSQGVFGTVGIAGDTIVCQGVDFQLGGLLKMVFPNNAETTVASGGIFILNNNQCTTLIPSGARSGFVTPVGVIGPSVLSYQQLYIDTGSPQILSFSPTSGNSGASVNLSGSNFATVTQVAFNGTSANFTKYSSTSLTATVPMGATTGRIGSQNRLGQGTSVANFTVNTPLGPPTIASFNPSSGPAGTRVIINGTNFVNVTQVKIGTKPASSFTVLSPTQIRAFVGGKSKTGNVSVSTQTGSFIGGIFTVQ